jgi:hypothetical protein
MLMTRARTTFPLSDEEIMVRNIHRISREAVEAYRRERTVDA